jgi:hypothetical protein
MGSVMAIGRKVFGSCLEEIKIGIEVGREYRGWCVYGLMFCDDELRAWVRHRSGYVCGNGAKHLKQMRGTQVGYLRNKIPCICGNSRRIGLTLNAAQVY